MNQQNILSHTDAFAIVDVIRQRAEQYGDALAVAVVDEHGDLLAFLRTDGCRLPSIQIAQNKAFTAAREQIETAILGQRSQEEGFPMTNFGDLRFTNWPGGIPIWFENKCIGAVGVSGLAGEDDVAYARHGIETVLNLS
jgi:glc operon protein GlcG